MIIVNIPGINAPGRPLGCELAFSKILENLKQIHSNEKGIPIIMQKTEEINLNNSNIQESIALIYEKAKNILNENEKPIFIGGDHSISYPLMKAFSEKNKDPFLIVFDAHPDLMPAMKEPTHEEWLRKCIEDKLVSTENIILIGVRNSDKEEIKFINENKIKTIDCNIILNDIEQTTFHIMELANKNKNPVYISIDIDVLDPAFAPGTSYHEPAGLTPRQLIYMLQRLKLLKNLKAIDIVEVNPKLDNGQTSKLAAKIIAELL
ncbi:arginase family protein [Candidatus Pacearchaeota archaeon]|nr:arginase family protein [Candidatus Pacearchaeota archaeon]